MGGWGLGGAGFGGGVAWEEDGLVEGLVWGEGRGGYVGVVVGEVEGVVLRFLGG